jgi:hypothetical protein
VDKRVVGHIRRAVADAARGRVAGEGQEGEDE